MASALKKAPAFAPVPFVNLGAQYLELRDTIIAKFDELSRAGQYILGDEVAAFEKEFAAFCETKHCVSVANATDGIMLALKAAGVGPGDEVITVPNSFIATAGGIIAAGGKPVFVDVASDYNMDPALLAKAVTKRTKAVMPVHLTGMPARMDEIGAIARQHGLAVIEDAAQAVGARYKGKRVGGLGSLGVFSLHPLKNLHLHGDGGAITTDNDDLAAKLRLLRNHGLINRDESVMWGYNSRLDAIQAAIGRIKLKYIEAWNKRYREIAGIYRENLRDLVWTPDDAKGMEGVYHNFVIMVEDRPRLQEYMLKHGQETKIHYPICIHLQKAASHLGYKNGDFPNAETQAAKILTLPIYPELSDDEVHAVAGLVRSFYGK
jgi:dTDP-4-amino-4,6-dideoxygalactose transaminase